MERRWLSLAHSYEFAERLPEFLVENAQAEGSLHPRPSIS
jgi:hypothetical protein